MAEKEAPLYCGSGKMVETEYGKLVNVSVCLDQIPAEFTNTDKQGRKWANLVLAKRKETSEYGETHSLRVNTWRPDKEKAAPKKDDEDW